MVSSLHFIRDLRRTWVSARLTYHVIEKTNKEFSEDSWAVAMIDRDGDIRGAVKKGGPLESRADEEDTGVEIWMWTLCWWVSGATWHSPKM